MNATGNMVVGSGGRHLGYETDGADYWLCSDCTVWACNGDASGIPDDLVQVVQDGVASLGPGLSPNYDSETGDGIRDFSSAGCDACGSGLAGELTRFAVLVPRKPRVRQLTWGSSEPFHNFGVQHEPGWEYVVEAESAEGALVPSRPRRIGTRGRPGGGRGIARVRRHTWWGAGGRLADE